MPTTAAIMNGSNWRCGFSTGQLNNSETEWYVCSKVISLKLGGLEGGEINKQFSD